MRNGPADTQGRGGEGQAVPQAPKQRCPCSLWRVDARVYNHQTGCGELHSIGGECATKEAVACGEPILKQGMSVRRQGESCSQTISAWHTIPFMQGNESVVPL